MDPRTICTTENPREKGCERKASVPSARNTIQQTPIGLLLDGTPLRRNISNSLDDRRRAQSWQHHHRDVKRLDDGSFLTHFIS